MDFLFELLYILGRVILLLFAVIFIYLFTNLAFMDVNNFLYKYDSPCIALLSILIAIVPVIAFFYGLHIRKYFWQRPNHYNWIIVIVTYIIGMILSFYPLSYIGVLHATGAYCPLHEDYSSKLQLSISTGIVTSLLAYLGVDIGVAVKHLGYKLQRKKHVPQKKRKSK